jgi:hypothetical protein
MGSSYSRALIATHAERNVPPGVRVYCDRLPFAAKPYFIPADHWGNEIVGRVLSEVYGRSPYFVRRGGMGKAPATTCRCAFAAGSRSRSKYACVMDSKF